MGRSTSRSSITRPRRGAATAAALLFSAALLLAFLAAALLFEAAAFLAALVFFAALAPLEDLAPLAAAGFFEAEARLPLDLALALAVVPDAVRFVRLRVFARGSLTFQHRGWQHSSQKGLLSYPGQ